MSTVSSSSLANIAYAVHDDLALVILHHGRHDPTNAEWGRFLKESYISHRITRVLVTTDGGHPSRAQQAQMNEIVPLVDARVAVVSPSVVARFVTSILVLTNPRIRCFAPEQRREAYAHLGFSPSESTHIDKLAAEVAGAIAQSTASLARF